MSKSCFNFFIDEVGRCVARALACQTSENEKLLAGINLFVPEGRTALLTRSGKEKSYYDHLTHLYNEKRPLSCTACCSRHYLAHYHRHTLLQCCIPLCRRHRNLVRMSSGAEVMADPSLLGLLQLGLCRCIACQAPSICKQTVGGNFKELSIYQIFAKTLTV